MADLVHPIYAPLKTVLDEFIPGWRDYISDPPQDRTGVTLHDPRWDLIGMRTKNDSLQDLYTASSKEKYKESCAEASLKYNALIEKLTARHFSAKLRSCWDAIVVDFPNGLEIYICPPPIAKAPSIESNPHGASRGGTDVNFPGTWQPTPDQTMQKIMPGHKADDLT